MNRPTYTVDISSNAFDFYESVVNSKNSISYPQFLLRVLFANNALHIQHEYTIDIINRICNYYLLQCTIIDEDTTNQQTLIS